MDETTLTKWIFDAGIAALVCFIVWQFISVLKLAMSSQAGAYDSLRQWFASELGKRDVDIKQEKAERMKLEGRMDEQELEHRAQIDALKCQLAEKEAEIASLRAEVASLKDADIQKESHLKEANRQIKELQDKLTTVEHQRDELKNRLDALEASANGKAKTEVKDAPDGK